MYGNNPIRPRLVTDGSTLEIQEVFHTLQGEGPFAGSPAVFIRTAGCNLACTFCDTDFESAYDRPGGATRTVREVVDKVAQVAQGARQRPLVVLTGGEPMRQNVLPLVDALIEEGYRVQVETAGVLNPQGDEDTWMAWVDDGWVVFVVSPKTARLGDFFQRVPSHYKYVVRAGEIGAEDGLPTTGTQLHHCAAPAAPTWQASPIIWLSPCDDYDPAKNAANTAAAVEACKLHGHRLSLQIHKTLHLP